MSMSINELRRTNDWLLQRARALEHEYGDAVEAYVPGVVAALRTSANEITDEITDKIADPT